MTGDLWLCGLRVRSALDLPELLPWTGDARAPEITIRVGPVPAILADATFTGPLFQAARDGTCRFEIATVASYLIRGGCEITVAPHDDAPAPDIRAFLLGTVMGSLWHQRGLLPLHASCVVLDGAAVALAGPSGAGKSSLAAALAARGHKILADDVTVLDLAGGGPMVLPGFPRVKLWRDAMGALGRSPDGLERGRARLEKFVVPLGESFATGPLPLAAVYHLETEADRGAEAQPLHGLEAVTRLERAIYRVEAAGWMGRSADVAASALRASAAIRRQVRFPRAGRHETIQATADRIVAHYRGDGG